MFVYLMPVWQPAQAVRGYRLGRSVQLCCQVTLNALLFVRFDTDAFT